MSVINVVAGLARICVQTLPSVLFVTSFILSARTTRPSLLQLCKAWASYGFLLLSELPELVLGASLPLGSWAVAPPPPGLARVPPAETPFSPLLARSALALQITSQRWLLREASTPRGSPPDATCLSFATLLVI